MKTFQLAQLDDILTENGAFFTIDNDMAHVDPNTLTAIFVTLWKMRDAWGESESLDVILSLMRPAVIDWTGSTLVAMVETL